MNFSEFFRAMWGPGKEPFPWQEDLAEQVLRGGWPSSIGLPTAAGKTALLDIAVFALAMGAPGAARRIFFVVDRRVIVDEAAQRAADLSARLAEAPSGSELGRLAQQLRELGRADTPLEVATIRGGIPRDYSWAGSPLQPAIVCSTVDQIGSSLLYRAYGVPGLRSEPLRASDSRKPGCVRFPDYSRRSSYQPTLRRNPEPHMPLPGVGRRAADSALSRSGDVGDAAPGDRLSRI
jgi:CRISPR-associated endonuclease/helicase Cas3